MKAVYEAGFSGFVLHRVLDGAEIENVVVHAASIEVSRKKTKTDKRDAQKLAEQLEAGRLQSIYIPSTEDMSQALLHEVMAAGIPAELQRVLSMQSEV